MMDGNGMINQIMDFINDAISYVYVYISVLDSHAFMFCAGKYDFFSDRVDLLRA